MELMRCDQLAIWCKQYEKSAVKEEAPKANVPAEMDGMVALKKNTIDGEDDVFATSRSKSTHSSHALSLHVLASVSPIERHTLFSTASTDTPKRITCLCCQSKFGRRHRMLYSM